MTLNDRERAIVYKTCIDCLLQFDKRTIREKAELILSQVIRERCRKLDLKGLQELLDDINEEYLAGETAIQYLMGELDKID